MRTNAAVWVVVSASAVVLLGFLGLAQLFPADVSAQHSWSGGGGSGSGGTKEIVFQIYGAADTTGHFFAGGGMEIAVPASTPVGVPKTLGGDNVPNAAKPFFVSVVAAYGSVDTLFTTGDWIDSTGTITAAQVDTGYFEIGDTSGTVWEAPHWYTEDVDFESRNGFGFAKHYGMMHGFWNNGGVDFTVTEVHISGMASSFDTSANFGVYYMDNYAGWVGNVGTMPDIPLVIDSNTYHGAANNDLDDHNMYSLRATGLSVAINADEGEGILPFVYQGSVNSMPNTTIRVVYTE